MTGFFFMSGGFKYKQGSQTAARVHEKGLAFITGRIIFECFSQ